MWQKALNFSRNKAALFKKHAARLDKTPPNDKLKNVWIVFHLQKLRSQSKQESTKLKKPEWQIANKYFRIADNCFPLSPLIRSKHRQFSSPNYPGRFKSHHLFSPSDHQQQAEQRAKETSNEAIGKTRLWNRKQGTVQLKVTAGFSMIAIEALLFVYLSWFPQFVVLQTMTIVLNFKWHPCRNAKIKFIKSLESRSLQCQFADHSKNNSVILRIKWKKSSLGKSISGWKSCPLSGGIYLCETL